MKPLLRYLGGKSWLVSYIPESFKEAINNNTTYIEPFCGSAAIALALKPQSCILNDLNSELINLYTVVKTSPEELILALKIMQETYYINGADYYYTVRNLDRIADFKQADDTTRAARFLFLNKTCFNGLWRENLHGFMNAPVGRTSSGKPPIIVQPEAINEVAEYLKTVTIYNKDYLEITALAKPNDCLLIDPPYWSNFTSYQAKGFTLEDTVKLRNECNRLRDLGCKLIITNDNNETIKDLFKDYNIQEVNVKRSINCKADNRKGSEVIITTNI